MRCRRTRGRLLEKICPRILMRATQNFGETALRVLGIEETISSWQKVFQMCTAFLSVTGMSRTGIFRIMWCGSGVLKARSASDITLRKKGMCEPRFGVEL